MESRNRCISQVTKFISAISATTRPIEVATPFLLSWVELTDIEAEAMANSKKTFVKIRTLDRTEL